MLDCAPTDPPFQLFLTGLDASSARGQLLFVYPNLMTVSDMTLNEALYKFLRQRFFLGKGKKFLNGLEPRPQLLRSQLYRDLLRQTAHCPEQLYARFCARTCQSGIAELAELERLAQHAHVAALHQLRAGPFEVQVEDRVYLGYKTATRHACEAVSLEQDLDLSETQSKNAESVRVGEYMLYLAGTDAAALRELAPRLEVMNKMLLDFERMFALISLNFGLMSPARRHKHVECEDAAALARCAFDRYVSALGKNNLLNLMAMFSLVLAHDFELCVGAGAERPDSFEQAADVPVQLDLAQSLLLTPRPDFPAVGAAMEGFRDRVTVHMSLEMILAAEAARGQRRQAVIDFVKYLLRTQNAQLIERVALDTWIVPTLDVRAINRAMRDSARPEEQPDLRLRDFFVLTQSVGFCFACFVRRFELSQKRAEEVLVLWLRKGLVRLVNGWGPPPHCPINGRSLFPASQKASPSQISDNCHEPSAAVKV